MRFKAINALRGPRRWAITGTPLHNKLSDYAALVQFVGVPQLNTPELWAEHVSSKLSGASSATDKEQRDILEILAAAFSLTRDSSVLPETAAAPEMREELVLMKFDKYDLRLNDVIKAKFRQVVGESDGSAASLTMLTKLRRLAAGGRALIPDRDELLPPGWSAAEPLEIGDDSDEEGNASKSWTSAQAYTHFEEQQSFGPVLCNSCENELELIDNGILGYTNPTCGHMWCAECADLLHAGISMSASPQDCHNSLNLVAIPGTPPAGPPPPSFVKTEQVLHDLYFYTSFAHKGDPRPNKVVVFSSWTATLDIIADRLRGDGIRFVRIDGRVPAARRVQAQATFNNDDEVRILLATTGTGGEGLTLTVANYVFLVDRQYNPAAEEQAVARIRRIGQTRSVACRSYVMQDSVEEAIIEAQRRKRALGSLVRDPGSVDSKAVGNQCKELAELMK